MTNNPHDLLAKKVFSRPAEARSLIQAFLPGKLLQALDLDSLAVEGASFVDRRLKDRHSDLLFSVKARDRDVLVYLLFEHKSYQDRWMVFQLLIYVTGIWASWRSEHGDDGRLPMILPIVLYHGPERWNRPLELIDLCDASDTARTLLGPAQPSLRLTLIDLSQFSESLLVEKLSRGTGLTTLTVLLMKSIRKAALVRRLRSWIPIVRRTRTEAGGRQMLELLVYYIYVAAREEIDRGELQDVLSHAVGPEAEELMMNTGEKLIQQGIEQGIAQGTEQGSQKARREYVLAVLEARFGDVPETHVRTIQETSDPGDLDRLIRKAAVIESLSEF